MNAATHMCRNCSHTPSLNIARHGLMSVTSPSRIVKPGGVVHPGVDRDHTERADDAGESHRNQHGQVAARRHPVPAVEIDAQEDGLDEEGQPFERERQAEHVAEAAHQARATTGPSRN